MNLPRTPDTVQDWPRLGVGDVSPLNAWISKDGQPL